MQRVEPDTSYLDRMVEHRRGGYLEEQALLRSLNQQRMLQGLKPATSLAEAIGGQVGAVKQVDAGPLQVNPAARGGRSPSVVEYQPPQDSGLGQAIGAVLGDGGGIRKMLEHLRAARDERAVPTPGVTRGQDLPLPGGTTAAPERGAPPPAGFPARSTTAPPLPPWLTDAVGSHFTRDLPAEPPVRGVPAPERQQAGPGQSGILARQRADYTSQMDANPAVKEKMLALMLAEEGGDRDARTALAETVYNRGNSRNIPTADQVMDRRYYQPMHDGSGSYERALERVRNDPKLRAELEADYRRAAGGSDVSKLATDNASAGVAANSKTNQTHTHTTANGESWFRKDVRPDVHGPLAVKQTKDWHDNTTAAMVDEKPEPAAEPGAEKPVDARWAPEQVAAYRAMEPAQQPQEPAQAARPQLTPEGLKAYGERQLAPGMTDKGNIDLNNRPVVQNPDGKVSTVRSIGVNVDGREVLLPTVSPDGKNLTTDEAVKLYRDSGQHLGKFDSVDSSNKYAQQLHLDQEQQYAPPPQAAPAQVTPEMSKALIGATQQPGAVPTALPPRNQGLKSALWDATRTDQAAPVAAPKPDLPAAPQAPPILAQEEPATPTIQSPTLPAGNAPAQILDAATTGQVPQSLQQLPTPQPVQQWEMPQPQQQMQAFGQGNLSPIPWDWMNGWGWGNSPSFGGGGGWGTPSFDVGGSGFDFFGGANMGGW